MAIGVRLCLCLLFAFAMLSSARNIPLSVNELVMAVEGRSLAASLEDYSDPSANHGHDPSSSRNKVGGGNGGGRKG